MFGPATPDNTVKGDRDIMSRYDYQDPGTDSAYCDGLQADEFSELSPADELPDGHCIYCGRESVSGDYCSAACRIDAVEDK